MIFPGLEIKKMAPTYCIQKETDLWFRCLALKHTMFISRFPAKVHKSFCLFALYKIFNWNAASLIVQGWDTSWMDRMMSSVSTASFVITSWQLVIGFNSDLSKGVA